MLCMEILVIIFNSKKRICNDRFCHLKPNVQKPFVDCLPFLNVILEELLSFANEAFITRHSGL